MPARTNNRQTNPYQMRFDLLAMAKDMLETNIHLAREAHVARGGKDEEFTPSGYSTTDMIETATTLNAFVSNDSETVR